MPRWFCSCMPVPSVVLLLTEQTRASTPALVKQLLKGVVRKNPSATVWADTCDVKKVLDLLHSWGKPSPLNYTHLTLKTVMILVLTIVNRPSDLNLRITPKAMQINEDSVTYQLMFSAKNVRVNHPHGPTIKLRHAEDECLCPVRIIKEYTVKTKDKEDQSEKLFVTRKMGLAVAASNSTMASWLGVTLTLANIRASRGSTRKAAANYAASQGASIRTIMEAGDWAHTSMMYGHYIRFLPREVTG